MDGDAAALFPPSYGSTTVPCRRSGMGQGEGSGAAASSQPFDFARRCPSFQPSPPPIVADVREPRAEDEKGNGKQKRHCRRHGMRHGRGEREEGNERVALPHSSGSDLFLVLEKCELRACLSRCGCPPFRLWKGQTRRRRKKKKNAFPTPRRGGRGEKDILVPRSWKGCCLGPSSLGRLHALCV